MSLKHVAILSGGDWNDASVNHILAPKDLNIDEAHAEYSIWYKEIYCAPENKTRHIRYLTFNEWLVQNKACVVDNIIEVFEE
jgi:hypothetical protein